MEQNRQHIMVLNPLSKHGRYGRIGAIFLPELSQDKSGMC